jgi:hypothetical protein
LFITQSFGIIIEVAVVVGNYIIVEGPGLPSSRLLEAKATN